MVLRRTSRWVALTAGLAVALPVAAAHAGDGAPAVNPAIVGVPIARTDQALSSAADAIDAGNGAEAASDLTASRRYLIRSYNGAKYLIAHPPPAPVAADRVKPSAYVRAARRAIRASRARRAGKGGWITAHSSGAPAVGPAFADGPTAVFNVLTSQYTAATAAVGMAPDTVGGLLTRVGTALNTAIVLRNRIVKIVHAASPPPPAAEDSVKARAADDDAPSFATVMPGLIALLDDEQQQMNALVADSSVPADVKDVLNKALAADQKIEALVNSYWPPVPAED